MDSQGKPITGQRNITFRLYESSSGGTIKWQGTYSRTLDKGIFSVMLGENNDTGYNFSTLPFDVQYWLGIQLEGDTEMSPRQLLASSGYAIRANVADEALQAQNATKVNNIEASTTPQANKILPLDANAKIPATALGLKTYDSGWFAIGANTNITKDHNLGTEKVIVQCIGATSTDGSGIHYLLQPYISLRPGGDRDGLRLAITSTQITLFTTSVGVCVWRDDGNEQYIRSLRIIVIALE